MKNIYSMRVESVGQYSAMAHHDVCNINICMWHSMYKYPQIKMCVDDVNVRMYFFNDGIINFY